MIEKGGENEKSKSQESQKGFKAGFQEKSQQKERKVKRGSSIKGVQLHRCKPSNVIDIFPLWERAYREGVFPYPVLNQNQISDYYWTMVDELASPLHYFLMAKRGRKVIGMLHAILAPRDTGPKWVCFVRLSYVQRDMRKLGIGKVMMEELISIMRAQGVRNFEGMVSDEMLDYWKKKRSVRKIANYVVAEV